MFKDYLKDLNVENAKNKHLNDVQNAKVFGIVLGTAKLETGLSIKLNVMLKLNN